MLCTQLGGPKPAPAYEGITVTEVFPGWYSNLEKVWLSDALINAPGKANWTNKDW
jgi:hypothetical protein